MNNIYKYDLFIIDSLVTIFLYFCCFLFVYAIHSGLTSFFESRQMSFRMLPLIIDLGVMLHITRWLQSFWLNELLVKIDLKILNTFRYIKPYNRKTFNHLYLNQEIDIDFIINKIIPLSIYRNNEKIHNHITVDEMLNMRSAFDESAEFNV